VGASGGRRPPAPIGWGSLTVRASFWRPMSQGGLAIAGSDPRLRARSPHRDGSLAGRLGRAPPPRQICRCRRRFRTTATSKTGAPSIGSSRTLRPGRARCARCSLAQITPHPVACCEPGAASSRAAWSPRAIPRLREPPRGGLLRRRERCASPTSATDFVHEHPADCCVSGCASTPLPPCGGSRRFERRLTLGHWPSGIEILGRPLCPLSR